MNIQKKQAAVLSALLFAGMLSTGPVWAEETAAAKVSASPEIQIIEVVDLAENGEEKTAEPEETPADEPEQTDSESEADTGTEESAETRSTVPTAALRALIVGAVLLAIGGFMIVAGSRKGTAAERARKKKKEKKKDRGD